MLNIVIFGPPGSGKGTQSLNIIKKYDLVHISTGDILREAIKNETPLGIKVKAFLDKGELVPDEIIINVLMDKAFSEDDKRGFVFDGFPRTINQAEKLDDILEAKAIPINLVIALDVEEEVLYKRMLGRKSNLGRSDDNEEVIKNRLDVYKNQTLPIFDYYRKQKKLVIINGMSAVDIVFDNMTQAIEAKAGIENC